MPEAPYSAAAARNIPPIVEVLEREFAGVTRVLEIGSGTGQHAVAFAAAMPHLLWQTSDLEENHAGIRAGLQSAGVDNVRLPLELDVRAVSTLVPASFDAVYSSNTAHIMSLDAVRDMFSLVADVLRTDGVFCLYGPFRLGGSFNAPSNEAFDRSLRARSPEMGLRDLETLDEFAAAGSLRRQRLYAVPSNNYVAVWMRKEVT